MCNRWNINTLYICSICITQHTQDIVYPHYFFMNYICISLCLCPSVIWKAAGMGGIGRNRTHSFAIYRITISVPNVSICKPKLCLQYPVYNTDRSSLMAYTGGFMPYRYYVKPIGGRGEISILWLSTPDLGFC